LYLPTAGALPGLRHVVSSVPRSATEAIAFAPNPEQLPGSRGEVAAFQRSEHAGRVVIGAGATEARVRAALQSAAIVHVAGHGLMNAANPLFSRLELHPGTSGRPDDDGRLEVHELLDVPITSALVFLSGCETGLGPTGSTVYARGEDFTTLAQAFLRSGAGNVVATLWPVQDDGAAVFAAAFYEELGRAEAVEALVRAQRRMLSQPRYSAPRYWAAYELSGRGELGLGEQTPSAVSVTR
jgi:CHAT domain-containing protein